MDFIPSRDGWSRNTAGRFMPRSASLMGHISISVLCDFRRFIWNFFRLENEHLNNCGQFRAVRDISVVPMETNDQAFLEQMMDDMEGLALTKRRGQHKRKTSVVLRSLRKMSSKGEGVTLRKDAKMVIENETVTSL